MFVRFSRDPELSDAVTRLAEQYGAEEEDQRTLLRETFTFVAQQAGLERAKSLADELSKSAIDTEANPEKDHYLPLVMGIVRAYLRNTRTVLTEEFLDGMGQRIFEFAYRLGFNQALLRLTSLREQAAGENDSATSSELPTGNSGHSTD